MALQWLRACTRSDFVAPLWYNVACQTLVCMQLWPHLILSPLADTYYLAMAPSTHTALPRPQRTLTFVIGFLLIYFFYVCMCLPFYLFIYLFVYFYLFVHSFTHTSVYLIIDWAPACAPCSMDMRGIIDSTSLSVSCTCTCATRAANQFPPVLSLIENGSVQVCLPQ